MIKLTIKLKEKSCNDNGEVTTCLVQVNIKETKIKGKESEIECLNELKSRLNLKNNIKVINKSNRKSIEELVNELLN